jgi:hypothetical protein
MCEFQFKNSKATNFSECLKIITYIQSEKFMNFLENRLSESRVVLELEYNLKNDQIIYGT